MRFRTRLLTGFAAAALLVAACETDDTADDAPVDDTDDTVDDDETVGDDTVGEDDTVDDEATDEDEVIEDEDDADDAGDADDAAQVDGELLVVAETDLGEVLVDHAGMTVYVHALDELEDGQPTCTGDCAALWQPVAAPQGDPEVGDGIDAGLVDTAEREDAEAVGLDEQLTYNGHPLYTFAADPEPGATRGHELADIWFALDADGEPLGEMPDEDELEELDMDEEEAEG